jgi:hypothetical protein
MSRVESFFSGCSWGRSPRWWLLSPSPYGMCECFAISVEVTLTVLSSDIVPISSTSSTGCCVGLSSSTSDDSLRRRFKFVALFFLALGSGSESSELDVSEGLSSSSLSTCHLRFFWCLRALRLGLADERCLGGIPFATVRVMIGMVILILRTNLLMYNTSH